MNSLLYGSPNPADLGDTIEEQCTRCNGEGKLYFAINIETGDCTEVTKTTYYLLPIDEDEAMRLGQRYIQGVWEKCDECNGEGVIYSEYEWDDCDSFKERY